MDSQRLLELSGFSREERSKRVFDIAVAVLSLLFLSPLLLLAAVAIKISSRGPILYWQPRRGLHGRVFNICKLRTFRNNVCDRPESNELTAVTENDPRVFAVGWLLRARGFDEVPQLWNVLRGEMSIVGPRPHALPHERFYLENIPGYAARYAMRPGITGWAQVNGNRGTIRSLAEAENRLSLDCDYLVRRSFALDLAIMLRTVPLLAFGSTGAAELRALRWLTHLSADLMKRRPYRPSRSAPPAAE